jgi:hypothetical protein
LVEAYTADKAKVLSLSQMVKETCCSSEAKTTGLRDNLHKHHKLGKRLGLVFIAKSLRFKLTNHLLGKSSKDIQGSEIKTKSGLYCLINFFRANLVGELARPLVFQKMHFI